MKGRWKMKDITVAMVLIILGLVFPSFLVAGEVTLAWDANSETNLAGYKLYYEEGDDDALYDGVTANEGESPIIIYLDDLADSSSPEFEVTGVTEGQLYNFALTAFDTDGLESDYSDEVAVVIGRGSSDDLDADGVPNTEDAFPYDVTESVDTDSDGIGNNADTDDDNDGVIDTEDAFPYDASESYDSDSDGVGNFADADDDNDGIKDVYEIAASTNSLDADDYPRPRDWLYDSEYGINWKAVDGAVIRHNIHLSPASGAWEMDISTGTSASSIYYIGDDFYRYTLGATPGYVFQIQGFNALGDMIFKSDETSTDLDGIPIEPANLRFEDGVLAWDGTYLLPCSVVVYDDPDGEPVDIIDVDGSELTDNIPYGKYVRVYAQNGFVIGLESDSLQIPDEVVANPYVVTGVAYNPSTQKVTWDVIANIKYYKVYLMEYGYYSFVTYTNSTTLPSGLHIHVSVVTTDNVEHERSDVIYLTNSGAVY